MKKFFKEYEDILHVLIFFISLLVMACFVAQESLAWEPIGVETEYWYNVADSLRQVIEEQNHNIANIPLRPTREEAFWVAVGPYLFAATIFLMWLIVLIYKFKMLPDLKYMFLNILRFFGRTKK